MPRECEKALVELGYWLCELHDGLRWRKKDTPYSLDNLTTALAAVEKYCNISVDELGNEIANALDSYKQGDRKAAGRFMKSAKFKFKNLFGEG